MNGPVPGLTVGFPVLPDKAAAALTAADTLNWTAFDLGELYEGTRREVLSGNSKAENRVQQEIYRFVALTNLRLQLLSQNGEPAPEDPAALRALEEIRTAVSPARLQTIEHFRPSFTAVFDTCWRIIDRTGLCARDIRDHTLRCASGSGGWLSSQCASVGAQLAAALPREGEPVVDRQSVTNFLTRHLRPSVPVDFFDCTDGLAVGVRPGTSPVVFRQVVENLDLWTCDSVAEAPLIRSFSSWLPLLSE